MHTMQNYISTKLHLLVLDNPGKCSFDRPIAFWGGFFALLLLTSPDHSRFSMYTQQFHRFVYLLHKYCVLHEHCITIEEK